MIHVNNEFHFHTLMEQGGYKSRIRIYSIDLNANPIDVSNEAEVVEYGTLLKYKNTDTDSNGRIGQKGIKISNYYNKDEQHEIGKSVSCSIEMSLINDDGFFSTFDWGKTIIVYWDAYEYRSGLTPGWVTCPLGIYWWSRPERTTAVNISATAYDAMDILSQYINFQFPSEDDPGWSSGYTLYDFYVRAVGNIPGIVVDTNAANLANMSNVSFFYAPFDPGNMTTREVLEKIAECMGGIAYARRDGKVTFKCFTNATYGQPEDPYYYTLNGDTGPTPIINLVISEYTVPVIDNFVAMIAQSGEQYHFPINNPGSETMYIYNNGFMADVPVATANNMAGAIYGVVSGLHPTSDMGSYVPIALEAYGDPTLEAGDIIRVIRKNVTYTMPIFQQILRWNGADWKCELQNSGYEHRKIPDKKDRESYYPTASQIHADIASASIDGSGLISYKNTYGKSIYSLQLPIYNGGVS